MPYYERIKNASYTSPSGRKVIFDFSELSRTVKHRVGAFSFSGVNGTLHQDRGVDGEVYPLKIYLHGQDYDLAADEFFEIAKETGAGYLEHPRWGRRRVQITSVTQDEDLVTGGGQAVFTVEFQETLEREFPKTAFAPQTQVTALADTAQADISSNYAEQVDTPTSVEKQSLISKMQDAATKVNDAFKSVVAAEKEISDKFRSYIDGIQNNVSALVQAPFEFATGITSAIRVVAEIPGRISSQLQGFQNLLNVISPETVPGSFAGAKNNVLVDELMATGAVIGLSESVNNGLANVASISRSSTSGKATIRVPEAEEGFRTRDEVLSAVAYLQSYSSEVIAILDDEQKAFANTVLSESYIQSAKSYVPVWLVAGTVIKSALDVSFSLPIKRAVTLNRPQLLVELCAKYYGNIDEATLDFFILTNGLAGDEIIEIPQGRKVVWYE